MKNINKLLLMLMIGSVIVSCEKDDFTGHSKQVPTSPSITSAGPTVGTVAQIDEDEFSYTVTMSEPQIVDVAVHVVQTAGDAIWGVNFDIDERMIISAGETTGSFTLSILEPGCDPASNLNFTLAIGDEKTANASISPLEISGTITPYVSSSLDMEFTWDGDFDGDTADDLVDIDIVVFDGGFNFIGGAFTGGFESFSLDGPADTYYIYADYWAGYDAGDFGPIEFPVTTDYARCGSFAGIQSVQTVDVITSADTGSADDSSISPFPLLATIVKAADGSYEIFDDTDTSLGGGRLDQATIDNMKAQIAANRTK